MCLSGIAKAQNPSLFPKLLLILKDSSSSRHIPISHRRLELLHGQGKGQESMEQTLPLGKAGTLRASENSHHPHPTPAGTSTGSWNTQLHKDRRVQFLTNPNPTPGTAGIPLPLGKSPSSIKIRVFQGKTGMLTCNVLKFCGSTPWAPGREGILDRPCCPTWAGDG